MLKKTHIAAIIPYRIYPAKMGGQKGIAMFYEYLAKILPVTMLGIRNQSPDRFDGNFEPVLSDSQFRYINPGLFLKIKRRIKNIGATHLILEHPYFGWLGLALQQVCKIQLVIHSHNIESLRFRSMRKWWWRILWHYERITHRGADVNFFITNEDKAYAIKEFKLQEVRCHTITYGIEMEKAPSPQDKMTARHRLEELYDIQPDQNILLFNGTLSYKPNLQALDNILNSINPSLQQTTGYNYKIIICGKGLPAEYNELRNYSTANIIYAGFVDDITLYFKGADIFLNPIVDGGGIKTKLVEALGYNNSAVSYASGCTGIPLEVTGNKLFIIPDDDLQQFVSAIISVRKEELIPAAFFNHFYWANIATKAALILQQAHALK